MKTYRETGVKRNLLRGDMALLAWDQNEMSSAAYAILEEIVEPVATDDTHAVDVPEHQYPVAAEVEVVVPMRPAPLTLEQRVDALWEKMMGGPLRGEA
jgi:hypothetical protein